MTNGIKCNICGIEKPQSEYYGHARICKRCICKRNSNKHYAANLLKNPDLPGEKWKNVVGYEGLYAVSNKGRVRKMGHGSYGGRIMTPMEINGGYLRVRLTKGEESKTFLVHRLVAMAFLSNPDNLPTVNHKDFDTRNNTVENLEWMTQRENNNYSRKAGHYYYSEKAHEKARLNRKISDDKAKLIFEEYQTGTKQSDLAAKYNVTRAFVCRLVRGKCRTELTGLKS